MKLVERNGIAAWTPLSSVSSAITGHRVLHQPPSATLIYIIYINFDLPVIDTRPLEIDRKACYINFVGKDQKRDKVETGAVDWERASKIFTPEKENYLERVRKNLDRYPLAKDALSIIAGFGFVSLAMLMPGLAGVIAKEVRQAERDKFRRRLARWKAQKLVEIEEGPNGPMVKITENGLKRALQYKLEAMEVKKPKRWDELWRIVIFDVAENKRERRDRFRQYLKQLGFYMLNRSVFIHPYPCFDEIEFLRQITSVGKEVTYIVAKSVESSADLRRYFDLQ